MRPAVALAVLLAASASATAGPACPAPDDAVVVTQVEAIDGDTVRRADGQLVRLAGVAAPKRPPGAAAATPPEAMARDALAGLLAAAPVRLAVAGDPDRYGRLTGDLYVADAGGAFVSVRPILAARGAVRVVRPSGDPACVAALYGAEAGAIEGGTGLWGDPDYAVVNAGDSSLVARKGLYEVVEGRVRSVGTRSYMTFVDFGADIRRDFTIMIAPGMVERLAEAGLDAEALPGRRVRVRGVIEASGGPAIRLKQADELTVLDD